MVAILVTPQIESLLRKANLLTHTQTTNTTTTVSHKTLLQALDPSTSLQTLLQSTELHLTHIDAVQKHTPPRRNAALEARLKKLRHRQQEAEYARITRDVSRASAQGNAELESLRLSKLAPQMSLAANVVVTMATCFAAGYFVMKSSGGGEAVALAGGVGGMIVAMVVEGVLLGLRLYGIEERAGVERKRREGRVR